MKKNVLHATFFYQKKSLEFGSAEQKLKQTFSYVKNILYFCNRL